MKKKEEMGVVVTQEELKTHTHGTGTDETTGEAYVLVDHEYVKKAEEEIEKVRLQK